MGYGRLSFHRVEASATQPVLSAAVMFCDVPLLRHQQLVPMPKTPGQAPERWWDQSMWEMSGTESIRFSLFQRGNCGVGSWNCSDVSKGKCVPQCHEGPLQWELNTYLPSTRLLISPEDVSLAPAQAMTHLSPFPVFVPLALDALMWETLQWLGWAGLPSCSVSETHTCPGGFSDHTMINVLTELNLGSYLLVASKVCVHSCSTND